MKPLYKRLNARQLIIVGISIPVLLLIVVEWFQWQSVREYRAAFKWVTHTRIVLLDLESLFSSINEAETGQRGYLLTHQEDYLAPYEYSLSHNHDKIQTLRQLTSDNPVQQKNLDRLEPLINAKFNEMAQTVALEKNLDHTGAVKIVTTGFGKDTMDQIRTLLNSMHDTERDLLQQREAAYQVSVWRNSALSSLVMIVGIGFIGVIVLLLQRLERMREMIKICAWSKLIEYEGEWLSIEDYLEKRFHFQITHGMSDTEAKKFLTLLNEEKQKAAA